MKKVALSEIKDDLSKYLRLAENEEIVITRHGTPAGVLVGFASEGDWFDYKLEHDPRFLKRIAQARESHNQPPTFAGSAPAATRNHRSATS